MAIRAAIGAGRREIIRQLLAESLLLGLAGGALGLLLSAWGNRGLMAFFPGGIPLPRLDQIGIDARVLAFTLLLALLTSVCFGLAPALTAAKVDLHEALKESAKSGGFRRSRFRGMLRARR